MNDLNQRLHGWLDRNEPTSNELDQLHSRIIERLAEEVKVDRMLPSARLSLRDRTGVGVRSAGWFAIVTAVASLLAIVSVFRHGARNEAPSPNDVDITSLSTSDLSERQPLFNELDRMFEGRWRWLSEVNGRMLLQTHESEHSTSTDPGVAVRLTVVQRRPGQTNWAVIWEASVLAHSEEWVRLPAELTGENAVSIWSHALPDGSMLVESDVSLTSPIAVRLTEPHVFNASSHPTRLWSTRRADGDFRLIQSIARLEANHG